MSTTTDDKVIELLDRTTDALPVSIRGIWALSCDPGDAWGDAMSHAFAVNDLACLMGWATDPTYDPGPFGPETEDWPSSEYIDDAQAGEITCQDVATAIAVFSTLLHALELLGLSY